MTSRSGKLLGRIGVRGLDATEVVLSDPVLMRSPFIKALGEATEPVLGQSRVCRLRPDGVAFSAGQPATSIIFVTAGELAVRVQGDEESLVAGTVPVGEITGAGAALGESTRDSTAVATGEAVLVEVPVEAFVHLLVEGSSLAECLHEAQRRDTRAADDMTDFLNRW